MNNVIVFLGGKPTNNYNNLAEVVFRLSAEPAAASTMAEEILQPGTRRGGPTAQGQHNTLPVANSNHHGNLSGEMVLRV